MRGPIDFIIVEFPKNDFKGEILTELSTAVQDGTIAVLDLSLVTKDAEGNVTAMGISDGEVFGEYVGAHSTGLIRSEDIAEMGEVMNNDSSAGLLIIEQLWAKGLKQAIINAGGVLVADGRIHPDAYNEIES